MKDEDFRQNLARVRAAIAINDARVMSNPKKYLQEMHERCCEILMLFDELEYALSPDLVFDVWDKSCDKIAIPRPADIQGEALFRCDAALDAINKYKYGK